MYTGIKTIELNEQELSDFYSGTLKVDALKNQYLLISLEEKIVDKFRYDGSKFVKLKYKAIESQILSKIKPRNQNQELLFDLLDTDIPLLSVAGVAGSGKTFCTTAHALQELQNGKYQKIVIIRNNIAVSHVPELGALPGSVVEKLGESVAYMGDIISPFLFNEFLQKEKIQIAYLGTMRSRSLSNSYILCNESQNLTTELVKMIITRVGEKSRLVFDFDLSQIDKAAFSKDNGMIAMTESLKGNPLFGMVELQDVERSEVAKLASLIK